MWFLYGLLIVLLLVVVYDVTQRRHAILRNFPILGHLRYLLEAIGPELRQYIVTNNDEERPFSRDQRRWVYASAKRQNNYFGFGTDDDLELSNNHIVIKHAVFAVPEARRGEKGHDPNHPVPCAKTLGGFHERKHAFRPESIISVSAMSFGSLSAAAVEALNRGCALTGALHNTGEGGIAPHHDQGAGLIYQLGTGYFGSRDDNGHFSKERFLETVGTHNVKAIEVKLSQGAKPGKGGILPGAKVTAEIARIRGVGIGDDCISPSTHSAFGNLAGMIDFIEDLADSTGLPVGIKSAIGQEEFWSELVAHMKKTGRGPDYIAVDGGEGGTGAAPLVFSDHVALPFKIGFSRIYRKFADAGISDDVVFVGSGRLGFPEDGLLAFALGCDMIGVAREAMLAIGCIQAQRCHTGHCPTGVATQNRWLMRGLDPTYKGNRAANYIMVLRRELMWLCRACGVAHPSLITTDHFEVLDGRYGSRSATEVFDYQAGWGLPGSTDRARLLELMKHG